MSNYGDRYEEALRTMYSKLYDELNTDKLWNINAMVLSYLEVEADNDLLYTEEDRKELIKLISDMRSRLR